MKQKCTNRTTKCIGLLRSCYHTVKISPKLRDKQCRTQRNDDNVDADNMTRMVVVMIMMMMMMIMMINGANVVLKKTGTIRRPLGVYALSTPPLIFIFYLTLRLLISYIYGAPSKARNANVVYIWTYVWQR